MMWENGFDGASRVTYSGDSELRSYIICLIMIPIESRRRRNLMTIGIRR